MRKVHVAFLRVALACTVIAFFVVGCRGVGFDNPELAGDGWAIAGDYTGKFLSFIILLPLHILAAGIDDPPSYSSSSYSRHSSYSYQSSSSTIREDAYGPGIHQDQYGRPVKYHVQGWPANEPTQNLRVKPNAYGPGIGMDQFGRPVTITPAF